MISCRVNPGITSIPLSKACYRAGFQLLAILLLVFWTEVWAKAQSAPAPPAQSQTQSQDQSQGPSQPQTAGQANSGDKQQSPGNATHAASADKEKPKAKHVYTEDDMAKLHGTISVVGKGSSGGGAAGNSYSNGSPGGNDAASSAGKDEEYWRGRAQAIKDQIAEVDRQIERVKDEIAKSGPGGFDATTGLAQNVIIVHDRNADLKDLQDRRQQLEKQLEELADEGRKAGADSGWFR